VSPPVSPLVSTPTSKIGAVGSLSLAVAPVLTSPVPEVPPLAVPEPSVGVESLALAVVAVVAVVVGAVGFVGFVGFVGDDSLAVAESAGSPDPQARAPERRRSEGMRAGRVEVISVHPGRMRDHTP
jgi:hypothetical protein